MPSLFVAMQSHITEFNYMIVSISVTQRPHKMN